MHLKNHSLLVYPCLYGISLSDSGRVGGALLSQERVPMSRRSTVGTFCSSFYHFYFFKIDLETCKERNCSLHRQEEIRTGKKKRSFTCHISCSWSPRLFCGREEKNMNVFCLLFWVLDVFQMLMFSLRV
jgi:hypothetical protein